MWKSFSFKRMNIHLYLYHGTKIHKGMGSTLIFAFMRTRDENKIEAIYREALKMLVNEGFDRLSMQKLAKMAGGCPATIYIYFSGKEELLLPIHKRELG